jgi:arylsulfatase
MKRLPTLWLLILALSAVSCKNVATTSKDTSPPNVVIIMADDLGYSDLGSFGGEIRTPHIDALAKNGVRFTQFRNAGRCCPSRASLLTGRGHHSVEMGWMTAVDEHRPG